MAASRRIGVVDINLTKKGNHDGRVRDYGERCPVVQSDERRQGGSGRAGGERAEPGVGGPGREAARGGPVRAE